jgi:hypothetical protein
MNELRAKVRVDQDHNITGIAPDDVPPGVHDVTINVAARPRKRLRLEDFPRHEGPWDTSISLRREDMYGDDGR